MTIRIGPRQGALTAHSITLESCPRGSASTLVEPSSGKPLLHHWGGTLVNRLEVPGEVYAMGLSPDGKTLACVTEYKDIVGGIRDYGTQLRIYLLSDGPYGSSVATPVMAQSFEFHDGRARGGSPRYNNRTLQFSKDGKHLLLGATWGEARGGGLYTSTAEIRIYSLEDPSRPKPCGVWSSEGLTLWDVCFGGSSNEIFASCSYEEMNLDPLGICEHESYSPKPYKLCRLLLGPDSAEEHRVIEAGLPSCRGFDRLHYQLDTNLLFVLEPIEFGPKYQGRYQLSTLDPTSADNLRRPLIGKRGSTTGFGIDSVTNNLWLAGTDQIEVIEQTQGNSRTYALPISSPLPILSGDVIFVPHQRPVLDKALDIYSIRDVRGSFVPISVRFQAFGSQEEGLLEKRSCYLTSWNHSQSTGLTMIGVVENDIERAWKSTQQKIVISPGHGVVSHDFVSEFDPQNPTSKSTIFFFET